MAKAKQKKQSTAKKPRKAPARKASSGTARAKPKAASSRSTVTKAVQEARKKATQLANNPAVAEVVAASLVAAAAAIKNPKTARSMAASVGDELQAASKQAVNRGNAFWKLALDIAKRSIDTLGAGGDGSGGKAKAGGKAKPKRAPVGYQGQGKPAARKKPKNSGRSISPRDRLGELRATSAPGLT